MYICGMKQPKNLITSAKILDIVSEKSGINKDLITGKSQERPISYARTMFVVLMRRYRSDSFLQIGTILTGRLNKPRNHSTLIHALKNHNDTLYRYDFDYTQVFDSCELEIKQISRDNYNENYKTVFGYIEKDCLIEYNGLIYKVVEVNEDNYKCVRNRRKTTFDYFEDVIIYKPIHKNY